MHADFAMALHFHQPVGNFDHVIEGACDKCYMPFLGVLKEYPEIKMTLHFTGCLLEWAVEKRPELISRVRDMAKSSQVEVMAGGFYEPIFSSIPHGDRLRQIELLREYVKKTFSYEAKGAWVAERVWEPDLPSMLSDAGIKYVVLDDAHFSYAGVPKDKIYGYYTTEDNGRVVSVFPSDKVLRYAIPYKMPAECMEYMRGVAQSKDDPLFVYGDDGEKFGEWPGTHKWVYEENWLRNFFDELMNNKEWLSTVKLSDCLDKRPPLGKVYLPAASYEEMLEWALPVDSQIEMEKVMKDIENSGKLEQYKPFIRGGFWRNFLSKYPESDHMNKKMIYVSSKLKEMQSDPKVKNKNLFEAERYLLRGQCNCAYWHGVFGGLYLFHLRRAIYHNLIKSETIMDSVRYKRKDFCESVIRDIDADGFDEVVLENKKLSLYFSPREGGILKEMDSKEVCHNLINSLTRRKEAYHGKILEKIAQSKEEEASGEVGSIHDGIQIAEAGLEEHLTYDWYNRYSLIDHFLAPGVDIDDFSKCIYEEHGDFVGGAYDFEVKKSNSGRTVIMKRNGTVRGKETLVKKRITLGKKDPAFTVEYTITNKAPEGAEFIFAPELNITMPDADSDRYSLIFNGMEDNIGLGGNAENSSVQDLSIKDGRGELSIEMGLSEKVKMWVFPVKTVSQSERAYELNYQSSAILPLVMLKLSPGKSHKFKLQVRLHHG
ncbi:MAG: DUF1926 domain-containing protein [Candidatus Omnitrophica bacterium]|nr:DUF1926 domain-containing protein [Candidatus Omnitrophota bacterium]